MDGDGLGEYLSARRALVDPATTALALGGGRRRVAGLRREEVAVLAGVSVDYYRRLEQGRERHPSPGVLEALAGVLELDWDARAHLHRLAVGALTLTSRSSTCAAPRAKSSWSTPRPPTAPAPAAWPCSARCRPPPAERASTDDPEVRPAAPHRRHITIPPWCRTPSRKRPSAVNSLSSM